MGAQEWGFTLSVQRESQLKTPTTQHLTLVVVDIGQRRTAAPVLHVYSSRLRKSSWTQTAHCPTIHQTAVLHSDTDVTMLR